MKKVVSVQDLKPGMTLNNDVFGANGQLLIKRGVCLTESYIHWLRRHGVKNVYIADPVPEAKQPEAKRVFKSSRAERPVQIPPKYIASFHRELISELPSLVRKVLIAPGLDPHDMRQILLQLNSMIQIPTVLDGLMKVRLTEENALSKALQVATLAIVMGQKMDLDNKQLNTLTIGALLYDIGNFWIDRKLLTARRQFDEQERRMIEEHTRIGYRTLKDTFDEEVARIAWQHHERYDGSGYPNRISRDEIDLLARIVSICDVYISLVTPRPYRQKYEPLEAMEYILGAGGTLFDPVIVPIFLEIIPVYSVGSMVELSNQCIGIVVNTTDKPLGRPVVEILYDETGQPKQDTFMDLTEHLTVSIKRIL